MELLTPCVLPLYLNALANTNAQEDLLSGGESATYRAVKTAAAAASTAVYAAVKEEL